jgi:two-component system, cell cycle sensor histidine kinase and response regulator CckA
MRDFFCNSLIGQMPAMSALAQLQLKAEEAADRPPTEQQMREAHKMEAIGRLVGGVAHDFNNLLTGMVLCSELILAGLEENHRLRRFAEEIRKAGEQGAGLIQQLMAVARQRAIEPRLLCLNDVVSEVRILLTRLIGENIELVAELAEDLGLIKMDLAQVQQIILNLVLNARDAMLDGGRVTVCTKNCDGPEPESDKQNHVCDSWVSLVVSDTGCGMDAEIRSRLFEPFFTTKKPGQGNGLGLATVHRIVTNEGGTIEVESETARGTRIIVHLPRVDPESCFVNLPVVVDEAMPVPSQKIRGPRKAEERGRSV